jgi:hypothetical protein
LLYRTFCRSPSSRLKRIDNSFSVTFMTRSPTLEIRIETNATVVTGTVPVNVSDVTQVETTLVVGGAAQSVADKCAIFTQHDLMLAARAGITVDPSTPECAGGPKLSKCPTMRCRIMIVRSDMAVNI